MEKKLYLTAIIAMAIGSWNIVQAKTGSGSATFTNNTTSTIWVQINFRKNNHKNRQGNLLTIQPGQSATGSWTDDLHNTYISIRQINPNDDGYYDPGKMGFAPYNQSIQIASNKISNGASISITALSTRTYPNGTSQPDDLTATSGSTTISTHIQT